MCLWATGGCQLWATVFLSVGPNLAHWWQFPRVAHRWDSEVPSIAPLVVLRQRSNNGPTLAQQIESQWPSVGSLQWPTRGATAGPTGSMDCCLIYTVKRLIFGGDLSWWIWLGPKNHQVK